MEARFHHLIKKKGKMVIVAFLSCNSDFFRRIVLYKHKCET